MGSILSRSGEQGERSSSHRSPAAAVLDDDDLLSEVLLRLPPLPSSLPRASLVCKRWRRLASDPAFSRRFRIHHRRNPPLLGCVFNDDRGLSFAPTPESPNRVPPRRFSLPSCHLPLGCRHGLILLSLDWLQLQPQFLVCDPITGEQHRLSIPPGFVPMDSINGAVLRAAGDVHFQFQVVLVVAMPYAHKQHRQALACVYSSETREWGDLFSTLIPSNSPTANPHSSGTDVFVSMNRDSVLVGNSLYWVLVGSDLFGILEFDLERQSLAVISLPADVFAKDACRFAVTRAGGGGLGFLFLSGFNAQLWRRKTDCDSVASWVLERTIDLDRLCSLNPGIGQWAPYIQGFAEDNNVVFLWTNSGIFMVHLDSLQFKRLSIRMISLCHPFESVYAGI